MKRFGSRKTGVAIGIAIVFVLMVFFRITGFASSITSPALSLAAPILSPFYALGSSLSHLFEPNKSIDELEAENARLREDLLRLKVDLAELEAAKSENISLRELLDYHEEGADALPKVVARIVGKDPNNASLLILNVGLRDGVQKNNAVVVQDGVMIAKVIEVFAQTAKAQLLTDSQSKVAVTLSGGIPSNKLAEGERGLSLLLDQIPQGESIKDGQLVITSGLEPTIPKGLIVGEVEEVVSESNDLFQKAILRPIVSYDQVYFVSVILSPKTQGL